MSSEIAISRTFDGELVRQVMTHPQIWPHISDDGTAPVEEWRPADPTAVLYMVARDGEEVLGLWMLLPQNSITWEIHTCLLPNAWGPRARQAAKMMAEWIWANTPCRRLVTTVPEPNQLAKRFAVRAGMQEYGRNPASFLKNGVLHDQVLLGISRPEEEECRQQQQ